MYRDATVEIGGFLIAFLAGFLLFHAPSFDVPHPAKTFLESEGDQLESAVSNLESEVEDLDDRLDGIQIHLDSVLQDRQDESSEQD